VRHWSILHKVSRDRTAQNRRRCSSRGCVDRTQQILIDALFRRHLLSRAPEHPLYEADRAATPAETADADRDKDHNAENDTKNDDGNRESEQLTVICALPNALVRSLVNAQEAPGRVT
jgi:hypothetical protein